MITSTWFSILLIFISIFVGAAIWGLILKIKRFEKFLRLAASLGPCVLMASFIYSLLVIKNVGYSLFVTICLSLLYSSIFIIMGILIVGTIIILSIGGYWLAVVLRKTNYRALWRHIRRDFFYGWNRIKAWIEGEE